MDGIANQIERLFFDGGKMRIKTHFEIGKSIHIDTYYYAKEYFNDSENCQQIGILLAEKIRAVFGRGTDLTLFGSGIYSGGYLNETVKNLVQQPNGEGRAANFGIIDNTDNKYSMFLEPEEINKTAVIILPITCTFVTAFNIQDFLATRYVKKSPHTRVSEKFISIFLVCDAAIFPLLGKDSTVALDSNWSDDPAAKDAYRSFGWKSLTKGEALLKRDRVGHAHFIIPLKSKFYLPEKCPRCFPTIPSRSNGNGPSENQGNSHVSAEYSLFPTRINHDVPDLIFGLPQFGNEGGHVATADFTKVKIPAESHLFGHLNLNRNSFLHYIKRSTFYELNKGAIWNWFRPVLEKELDGFAADTRVLIVTPKHNRSSNLLQDIIQLDVLKNKHVSIIMMDITEPHENFKIEFERHDNYAKIFFFDHVISGGKTYMIFNSTLRFVTKTRGFDKLFFVSDRTTLDSKAEIARTLKDADDFVAFFKLDIPLVTATGSGNPIQDRLIFLQKIIPKCQLDALKMYFASELAKGAPKDMDRFEETYATVRQVAKERYLRKLHVSHDLGKWFARHGKMQPASRFSNFALGELTALLEEFSGNYEVYFTNATDDYGPEERKDQIRNIVVKALSRPPFKQYHGIYQAVFEYTLAHLVKFVDSLDAEKLTVQRLPGGVAVNTKKDVADTLREFKFYVKRSAQLNSNAIISEWFIGRMKDLFSAEPTTELPSIQYFLLKCLKELVFVNHARSIELERVINQPRMLPAPWRDHAMPVKQAIKDPFYQFGRLVKTENGYLLGQLKDKLVQDIREAQSSSGKSNRWNRPVNATPADMATFIRSIRDHIMAEYIDNPTSSNRKIALANIFNQHSLNEKAERERMLLAMMTAVYFLEDTNQNEEHVVTNMKSILNELCSIVGTGLEYAFFIEYKERNKLDPEDCSNIVTILSTSNSNGVENVALDPEGFVYKMLYGISDDVKEDNRDADHIQTLVVIVKDGDEVYSFKDVYYDELKQEVRPKNITKDYGRYGRGLKMFSDARMILLLRIADVEANDSEFEYVGKGQGVFAICLPEPTFAQSEMTPTQALVDFISVEKLRLILLAKSDLLRYLKRQFESDVFISLQQEIRANELKRLMEHGVDRYFNCMDRTLRNNKLTDEDVYLLRYLRQTIHYHLFAIAEIPLAQKNEPSKVISRRGFEEAFRTIMHAPFLADRYLPDEEIHFKPDFREMHVHPVIWSLVIPELLINMRRAAIRCFGYRKTFYFGLRGNVLTLENNFNPEFLNARSVEEAAAKRKKEGGINMCKRILQDLDLGDLSITERRDNGKSICIISFKIEQHERY